MRPKFIALLTKSGRIKIQGPDGQTVIDQGTLDTDEVFASNATISAQLNVGSSVYIGSGVDAQQSNGARVLVGTTSGGVPYVRAQHDYNDYVQIVGVSNASNNFFEIKSGGDVVASANNSGLTIGDKFEIKNPGGDFLIHKEGIVMAAAGSSTTPNAIRFRDSLPSGTQRGTVVADTGTFIVSAQNGWDLELNASGGGDILIGTLGNIRFPLVPSSNPGGSYRLWRDSSGYARLS